MAIGVYMHSGSMTAAQYDETIRELEDAGEGRPAGRVFHSCFGPDDNLMVFDVWESEQAFAAFGAILEPILAKAGIEAKPDVMPMHNMMF